MGFPGSSVGKESACNAGDPSSIPGLGRSPGEGIGYPLQYSWASLVAQLVKNPPAMQETWFRSLGWEDPLEKGMATHYSILAWRIPWTAYSMGSQSQTRLSDFHFTFTRIVNEMFRSVQFSCSVLSDSLQPHGLYSPLNSPGQNTGVGNLSLLQGIFPTQGSNPGLPYCRQILYQLSHKGSPIIQYSLNILKENLIFLLKYS